MMRKKAIYQRYEALSPIYQGYLSNHLPMVLTALKQFGVSDTNIIQRLDDYVKQRNILDLTEITTPISEFEQAYINRTSFYMSELNNKGKDIVIGSFLSKYKEYLGSALFHGLIRLSYAILEDNNLLVAQALAYYELTSERMDFPNEYVSKESFYNNYSLLLESFQSSRYTIDISKTTMERFSEILQLETTKKHLKKIHHPSKDFLLDFILSMYIKTQGFIPLHLLTGFDALCALEEYIFDFDQTLNQYLLYAQVFSLFQNKEVAMPELKPISIEEAIHRVEELQDIHDIKLLFSLQRLNKMFDNPKINIILTILFNK